MQSRVGTAVSRERAARIAAMTPEARVAVAARLGEEGLAQYMRTHGLDRRSAVARIKATRRLGRQRSPSAEADER